MGVPKMDGVFVNGKILSRNGWETGLKPYDLSQTTNKHQQRMSCKFTQFWGHHVGVCVDTWHSWFWRKWEVKECQQCRHQWLDMVGHGDDSALGNFDSLPRRAKVSRYKSQGTLAVRSMDASYSQASNHHDAVWSTPFTNPFVREFCWRRSKSRQNKNINVFSWGNTSSMETPRPTMLTRILSRNIYIDSLVFFWEFSSRPAAGNCQGIFPHEFPQCFHPKTRFPSTNIEPLAAMFSLMGQIPSKP